MKKKFIISIIIVIFSIFFLALVLNYNLIINFLLSLNLNEKIILYSYFGICFLCFLTPFPVTILILLNGYLLKDKGFFLSFILVITCSYLIILFSQKIITTLEINIDRIFKNKKIDISKFSNNIYTIFISRYFVPYFFHNLYYGFTKLSLKNFFIGITLAELPMIFSLNSIGKSLKKFSLEQNYTLIDLLKDANFYIPLSIVIFIFFFGIYIKKS